MSEQKNKSTLPFGFIPLWASKAVSAGMSSMLIMQFTYYATEVVGLEARLVGTLILASRFLDAVLGMLAGFVVDKTNTRFGKGRHFDLFLIPTWVCVVLLFSVPNVSMKGKLFYAFIFYTLTVSVLSTLLGSGDTAYLGRAVPDEHHRAKVTSVSGVLVMLVCAVGGILLPQLMVTWGMRSRGWSLISLFYAVPMCAIGMLRFFTIKEQPIGDAITGTQKIGMAESLRVICKNRYVFILAPASLLCNLALNVSSTVATFYYTYIVGNLGMMSFVSMIGLVSPLILLMFPAAIRTIGGMNYVRIGLILAISGNLLKLVDPANIVLLVVGQLLANIGLSAFALVMSYFVLQVIDHGEKISGKRVEGFSSAINTLFSKTGAGLSSMLFGSLMALSGYTRMSAGQPLTALNTIIALYSWIPAIFCTLTLITVHFYDLDKPSHVYFKRKSQES